VISVGLLAGILASGLALDSAVSERCSGRRGARASV